MASPKTIKPLTVSERHRRVLDRILAAMALIRVNTSEDVAAVDLLKEAEHEMCCLAEVPDSVRSAPAPEV